MVLTSPANLVCCFRCAAVRVKEAAANVSGLQADTDMDTAARCELIYGSEQLGVFQRTLLRSAVGQLNMPTNLQVQGL